MSFRVNEVNYCEKTIASKVPFRLTDGQARVVHEISIFLESQVERRAYVLCGYAGTGKTTLISALVMAMHAMRRRVVLLAPTGRAAKVFANYSHTPAYTIHKRIYRRKTSLEDSSFSLDRNLCENTLFIVDEASMIANEGLSGALFGTGRLLDDLISYVYSGPGCSLLLCGDTAQLPPVGESLSPALDLSHLKSYGLAVARRTLTQVVRQEENSGVLYNATRLRDSLPPIEDFAGWSGAATGFHFVIDGFDDVRKIRGDELVECINGRYSADGIGETIVLCRSNKRANIYNNGIRSSILDREDELCRGDRLMIVKNNYYWTEHLIMDMAESGQMTENVPSFIANGDMAEVLRVRHERELYGFRFVDVTLVFPDYDDCEMEVTLLLDTLHSEAPALTGEQQEQLFHAVLEDYADIPDRKERLRKLRDDVHYNAFQVKYAYAVTCHKAQGGQWKNVFIDQGYVPEEGQDLEYYRWLYTALTRATGTVYLVNWSED